MITSLLSIATARRKQHLPLLLAVAILLVACNPAPVSPDSNGPSVASWPATSPTSANPETGAAAWQAKLRQCMVIPHDYNDLILAQGKSFKPYFEYTVVDGKPYIRASSYDQSLWSIFDITVTESPSFGESGEFYDSRFHLVRLRKDRPNPNSYSLPEDAECRLEIDLAANMALLNGEPHEAMPASYRDGLYIIMISVTDILEAFDIEWASSTDYTFIGPWSRQLAEETTREQYAMIQAYFALGPLEENPFYLMEESDVRYLASFQDSIIVPISTGEPLSSPEGNWFIRDGFFVEIIIDDSVQKIMCGLLNAETGFLTKFTLSLDYGYSDRFISAYNIYPTDAGTFLTIQLGSPTMGHQEIHFIPAGEQETVAIAYGNFSSYFGLYGETLFFLESNSGPWAPGPGNLVRYSLATGQSSHLSLGSYVFGFAAYHYGSGYTHGPSGSFFLPDARLLTVGSTLSGFLEESSQNCLLLVDLFNPAQSVILTPDTLISGFSWHDPLAVFLEADSGRLGIVLLTQDEPTPERILSDAAVTRYRVNEGKLLYLTGDNALYALDFLNENESICLISAGAYSDAGIDDFLYWMGNVYFTLSNGELWAVKLDDANNLPHLVAGEVQSMTVGNDGVYFLRGGLNPGLSRVANGVVEELYTGLTQALGNNNLGEVVFLPARSDGSFMIFR